MRISVWEYVRLPGCAALIVGPGGRVIHTYYYSSVPTGVLKYPPGTRAMPGTGAVPGTMPGTRAVLGTQAMLEKGSAGGKGSAGDTGNPGDKGNAVDVGSARDQGQGQCWGRGGCPGATPPPPPSGGPKCLIRPDHRTSQYGEIHSRRRRWKILVPRLKRPAKSVTPSVYCQNAQFFVANFSGPPRRQGLCSSFSFCGHIDLSQMGTNGDKRRRLNKHVK